MGDASHNHGSGSRPTPMQRLVRLLAEERRDVGVVFLYAAVAGLLGLSLPLGVQAIIGLVSGGMILQPAAILIAVVVLGTFAAGAMQIVILGVVERLQQRIFARYALELAHRVPRADVEALDGIDLPELTNRFFDVITIQKSLAKLLTESVAALLAVLAGLVLLTLYHPYLSLFGAALIGALAAVLWVTGNAGLRTSLAESSAKYRIAHWLQELARHAGTFHLAGASALPVARMDHEVDDYLTHRQGHFRVLARQAMGVVALKTIATGGMLIIGAALVVNRKITLGQFVASELVIVTVLAGVEKLILSLATVYDALTAVEKAGYLRDVPASEVDDEIGHHGVVPLPLAAGSRGLSVELTGLSYRYAGQEEDAIQSLTLTIRPGDRVALVGSEGAGATTLLQVLGGIQIGYRGALAYDGVSARDADRTALHGAIGFVGPMPSLFDATLEENVAIGRPGISSGVVASALEFVGLHDWLRGLPNGLRTRVGGNDLRAPSHIVRKIALARAIAGKPRLVLFDEFFHHLDPAYKRSLLARLADPRAGWTIVAASHDPTYLGTCDRVVLLDGGRVVADGTYASLHDELARRGLLRASQGTPADGDARLLDRTPAVAGRDA